MTVIARVSHAVPLNACHRGNELSKQLPRPVLRSLDNYILVLCLMADICKKEINVKELEAELQKQIDDDARYWRENDAKFRAIDQKVATYDEFRDMVKAAHLQPVKKSEVQHNPDKARKRVWNTIAPKQKEISQENYCQHELYRMGKSSGTIVPTTLPQFCQEWRRLPKTEHLSFLKTVGSFSLAKVLQSELPAVEFGEIIMALSEYSSEDAPFVVSLLKIFASAKRYGVMFCIFCYIPYDY
ncbi:coiled-coil domain-containing protein 103 [Schistocerca gregaria]|uniref:coiled-coil domain-containing protein 103 n=1 Tax=Schistocerca gregaria TaxID=7010 RepID=UPI00211EFA5A|nr:coiled-coil domain-containing protein 103 [Schistocerca gregaria]